MKEVKEFLLFTLASVVFLLLALGLIVWAQGGHDVPQVQATSDEEEAQIKAEELKLMRRHSDTSSANEAAYARLQERYQEMIHSNESGAATVDPSYNATGGKR